MSSPTGRLPENTFWEPAKKKNQGPFLVRAQSWIHDTLRNPGSDKPNSSERPSPPLRRTAWLDGLRGVAAFLVYIGHHELWAHEILKGGHRLENAWGFENEWYFAAMPFVRLIFCGGHFAVSIFFVISGYVLAAKPLSLIQAGEYHKLHENLASALFRRWLRLHIPLIVTTFVYLHVARFVIEPASLKLQGNYRDELWNWYTEIKNFSFVFRMGGEPWFSYNFHTWSIPIEFKGSIAIYTALFALARTTRNVRLGAQVILAFYYLYIVDGWFLALFTMGMLICDLDLLAMSGNLPRPVAMFAPFKTYIYSSLLIFALFLGGVPAHNWDVSTLQKSPGWYYLYYLKPYAVFDYKWFYLFWAATWIVAAIPRLTWIKRFFETRFCQYLGRISFSLYLVHGPIIWTIGERMYAATGIKTEVATFAIPWMGKFPISTRGPLGLEPATIAPQIILLPLTFWVAELVTKFVDEPSVKIAQRLYNMVKGRPPAIKI